MGNLDKRGIEFVVQGESQFLRSIDNVNRATSSLTKNFSALAKGGSGSGIGGLSNKIGSVFQSLNKDAGGSVAKLAQFGTALSNVGGPLQAVGVGLAGLPAGFAALASPIGLAGAALAGFTALAARGAVYKNIEQGFLNISQNAGLASNFLDQLSAASANTISRFDLMRNTNLALAGSTGEFAKQFGQNLPKLLEIARVQAQTTGESVDFLFESLVRGIKRGSPLLIDNTGLVLKLSDAYDAYAQKLGISADQLTENQKQIALISATVAAGQSAIDAAGGATVTTADKLAAVPVRIQNILDQIGKAFEPLLSSILDVVHAFIAPIEGIINVVAPIVEFIFWAANQITAIFSGVFNAVAGFVGGVTSLLLDPFIDIFNNGITALQQLAYVVVYGGAQVMGGLANGLLQGAADYVLPAVIEIATAIANFLVGESPPPMGPLSAIDKGGANTMSAWLAGFAGVSLDPIQQVAGEVAAAMGPVARLGLEAVEKRLGQLDAALRPFSDRLAIAKSRFEAIQKPAEAALRAVDRQLDKAVAALSTGDERAAVLVRSLDERRGQITDALDAAQTMTDQAELQLALAQAQQSEERTLLELRKSQFDLTKDDKKLKEKVLKETAPKEEKKKKGEAEEPKATGPGGPSGPLPKADNANPLIGFFEGAGEVFNQTLEEGGGLAAFNEKKGLLDEQIGRIRNVNFADRIGSMFGNIGAALETSLLQPFREKVDQVINWLTNAADPNSLAYGFNNFVSGIGPWLSGLPNAISLNFQSVISSAITGVKNFLTNLSDPTSLASTLTGLPGRLLFWLTTLPTQLGSVFEQPFSTTISNILGALFSLENPDSLASQMLALPGRITGWLVELPQKLIEFFETPFGSAVGTVIANLVGLDNPDSLASKLLTFFSGGSETEGTLRYYLKSAYDAFLAFPGQIGNALANVGVSIWNTIAVPVINILNWVIDRFNEFISTINGAAEAVRKFLQDLSIQIPEIGFGEIPRISTAPPDFLAGGLPGAATGGLFSRGLFKVGEKGPELIYNAAEKIGVIPNQLTALLQQAIAPVPGRAVPAVGPSASYGPQSNDYSQNNTFQYVHDTRDLMQRMAITQARRRRVR